MRELAARYSFKDSEEKQYLYWEKNNFFHAEVNPKKDHFSIVIPPPNVTGFLHMGHALNNTFQDILIRYKKMNGFVTLWMPGTDHAGIATQNVVEKKIAKEGLTRQDLGRDKFLERVWQWKQEYGSTIIKQLRRLGCACDWQRTRFTMDSEYSAAVIEVFIRLYNKGYIYRGNYIINWCPRCQTALSDEEAPHKEIDGFLYYIKYPIQNSDQFIVVATTRPETMLGDTAVAVNPKDSRYAGLIGKTVILPLMKREIKIIADDFVDPEFGTGAVKVTPAHDPNDYAMGKRHNLESINIFYPDARCNENAGDYAGRDRFQARQAIIEDLKERKLLLKVDNHRHAVGHCYRCHTVIEPYLSKQWFVKMKPLSLPGIKAVEEGRIKFYPERWTKVYLNWMENIHDWCISRQIWWGHRLPVYYCKNCVEETGSKSQISNPKLPVNNESQAETKSKTDYLRQEIEKGVIVSKTKPEKCPDCAGTDFYQDNDVLDTWFSSWLWPFATFGWPFESHKSQVTSHKLIKKVDTIGYRPSTLEDQKKELNYFYPTAVLVTAPEIIFFWVARMIMSGFEFMGDIPFKDVYIHGTVRDDTGKKMSKSLGNSIDPLEIIEEYGTDALRFSLISITSVGQDVYLSKDKFEFGRNFCNKIWNASRFILMNLDEEFITSDKKQPFESAGLTLAEEWIISRFYSTLRNVNKALSGYRLNEAANLLYEFFWHQFCDWYIELAKLNIKDRATQAVLYDILEKTLRLLHPFMPFITDDIWQKFNSDSASIMTQTWPCEQTQLINESLESDLDVLREVIVLIRNMRSSNNIPPKQEIELSIRAENKNKEDILRKYSDYFKRLARVKTINFSVAKEKLPGAAVSSGVASGCVVYLHVLIDTEKEKEKIKAQITQIEQFIAKKSALLSNENYLKKAPSSVVEKEKQSLSDLRGEMDKLSKIYETLS